MGLCFVWVLLGLWVILFGWRDHAGVEPVKSFQ